MYKWTLLFVSIVTLEELCKNVEHQNSYDGIIASELLEHITDVDHFIGNMGKLLKVRFNSWERTIRYRITFNIFLFLSSQKVFVLWRLWIKHWLHTFSVFWLLNIFCVSFHLVRTHGVNFYVHKILQIYLKKVKLRFFDALLLMTIFVSSRWIFCISCSWHVL